MTYEQALQYLTDLAPRGWRLGLDRMQEFVSRAGLTPYLGGPDGPQYIHVAGTNGKGSVTAFVQSMLLAAGHSTGAFFSPYVVDPRERVWFGKEMISEEAFTRAIERLAPIAESLDDTEFGGVTEFEMKTAVGFEHWMRRGAEWVALEVGLGGRFDATNVVTPRVSVIVSIGMDHVQILGDTLEKIAFEKAGIIKPAVPVVIGDMAPEARDVIAAVANNAGSCVWRFDEDICLRPLSEGVWSVTTPRSTAVLRPSLYGDVQGHNAALAYAAMELAGAGSGQDLADGLQFAGLPGRFQRLNVREREIILDGAHNAEAAENLCKSLRAYLRSRPGARVTMVSGMVAGHDPAHFYGPFQGLAGAVHLAPIDFHRAVAPEVLKDTIGGLFEEVTAHKSLNDAIQAAFASAEASDVILVTGSFYLVGEVIRLLTLPKQPVSTTVPGDTSTPG